MTNYLKEETTHNKNYTNTAGKINLFTDYNLFLLQMCSFLFFETHHILKNFSMTNILSFHYVKLQNYLYLYSTHHSLVSLLSRDIFPSKTLLRL
ncbi:hypothetical protein VIGAN_09181500 [Vigna angularis var. angularis]|uniref:Uncharacterized protein n=1 Tax=Vigna angularis var. angularis TaxID=157739 RepID=A0A0S3SZN9_PHAAN|nr:hypothetical protein VIGAN_09181500 [Vigna angularis var. angularis]